MPVDKLSPSPSPDASPDASPDPSPGHSPGRSRDDSAGHPPPRFTSSGIEVEPVYRAAGHGPLGEPGEFPFTRGPYATMYRGRPWTMRQYAGFGTAEETNRRFRELLAAGQTGLSVAFDLPTQMGLDSDAPAAAGEVGKVGVAVDGLEDMRVLVDGLPLGEVSVSMTINATAPILLLLYQLAAEERGVPRERIRGTVQNDILKEYIARGTYIYPPGPSMRLVTDLFAYCGRELPNWNTISVSGYHIREAGATAAQEIAFTLANGIAYVEAARAAGLDADAFAPRISFFWNAHNHLFEEAAKFRAARRMWAGIMKNRFRAASPAAQRMRFHAQTAGSTLTAQQPENNIVRTAVQAAAAILGGTQSLHTNAYDEALGLPTASSARLALRTQQVLAEESGLTDAVDPLAGSYYAEALTDRLEEAAARLIAEIDRRGGATAAIEAGYQQGEIEEAAYRTSVRIESGDQGVVGVNRHADASDPPLESMAVDADLERAQRERVISRKAARRGAGAESALAEVRSAAVSGDNLMYPMKTALAAGASLGEVSDALRETFGVYRPG